MFESAIAVCLGIGLAASCGFRIFIPLLVIALASRAGLLGVSEEFQWLGTWPAIACLGVATLAEIGGYYIPLVDNLLDTIATPVAVVGGAMAAAACVTDMDPLLRWTVIAISGGGISGLIKLGTVGLRAISTLSTGGTGNPIVSTAEWIVSAVLSIIAILLPVLAAVAALILVGVMSRFALALLRLRRRHPSRQHGNS